MVWNKTSEIKPPLKKLRVINAAKNRMVDLKPLDLITSLHNLDISHNLLEDLQDVIDVLSRIPGLKVQLAILKMSN